MPSGTSFLPFVSGEPVQGQVPFRAQDALSLLKAYGDEEAFGSDHECEEFLGANVFEGTHSTPLQEDAPARRLNKQQKAHANYRMKRKAQRMEAQESEGTGLKAVSSKKRLQSMARSIPFPISYQGSFAPSKPGWKAQTDHKNLSNEYGLDELICEHGMRVVPWDGRECRPIIDSDGVVIGVLGSVPKDDGWEGVCETAAAAIEEARGKLRVPQKNLNHRRGVFPALSMGLSHGGGQGSPGNLKNGKHNTPILEELILHPSMRRIAGLSNGFFRAFAPRLHAYYVNTLDRVIDWSPHNARRNYDGTAYAAMAINFGPRVVAVPHRDWANLSWGWCSISALGNFDHKKGGHLVLWELGLIVEFPRGTSITIPSAMIQHSNTPIATGETRYSIAQYSASGLFRWVENGFVTDEDWLKAASKAQKAQRKEANERRWDEGLKMLSHVSDFKL